MISELTRENSAIAQIHKNHLYHKRLNLYVMLETEDIDWYWDESEVLEFDELFKQGMSIHELAEYFNRPPVEIALLTIDRELKEKIGSGRDERSAI